MKRLMARRSLKLESLELRSMLTTLFVESGAENGDGTAKAPFGSIQEAIDAAAARPGADTVSIGRGVYTELLDIDDADALTIKGRGDVTVQFPATQPIQDVIESKGNVTFQNLTVEGPNQEGDTSSRGIDAQDGIVKLLNVRIWGTGSDTLRVRDAEKIEIINSLFSQSLDGDGIDIEDSGHVRVVHSTVRDNSDEGLEVDNVDSIFVVGGCYTGNGGEGIDIDNSDEIRVVNVVASRNGGSGLQIEAGDDDDADLDIITKISIVGSRFENNSLHGVEIVAAQDGVIEELELLGNWSVENTDMAFNIGASKVLKALGNKAWGNGDDTLP